MSGGNRIAIVGMALRFPGAAGAEALWRNLRDGVESVSFFGAEELRQAGADPALASRPGYVGARGYLDGIEEIDAGFFGFSPLEAQIMDPQQRLFLESAWHALEDAGYDPGAHTGAIGLYAACGMNNYLLTRLLRNPEILAAAGEAYVRVANRLDNLATRTAYKLDLRGPSLTVQTGCSSSLVAVHLACQGLLSGETDMALAGGVRINILSKQGYLYEEGSVLSPDGHTRAFDGEARGTIAGDGVGVVVLKRLDDALADGDTVRAVLLGSAVNNDGAAKIGYTAPSVDGQAWVISEALAMAGVEADSISYVEAHGTGTPLGDPIEVAALTRAFRASTERRGFCALGSIKTNFGHLDAAAGVAGLIKAVLALQHRQIPPSLHFERPNPEIDFAASPFRVAERLADWPAGPTPRRAGVSSFGIGGTNVHAILEEAPETAPAAPGRPWQLLVLSARSAAALAAAGGALGEALRRRPHLALADVAYTLQTGRRGFEHRRALVVRGGEEAARALAPPQKAAAQEAAGPVAAPVPFDLTAPAPIRTGVAGAGGERPLAFLFPGQGSQRPGMALGLYRDEPSFRADVDRCAELLAPHLDLDLFAALAATPGDEEGGGPLAETRAAQPALFVLEYSLARLWMRWGVRPDAMAGHSLGEYVAACLAGVMELPDALALVAVRGRLMQETAPGAMLAVPLAPEALAPELAGVELAAVNGPELCVVSGPVPAVEALAEGLAAAGVDARRLRTTRGFHSALVEPMMPAFGELLAGIELAPPRIPFLSNLTGTWITAAQATDRGYWLEHLRRPVRFGDGLAELLRAPGRILLEVGPGRTLSTLARRHPELGDDHLVVPSLPGGEESAADLAQVLAGLGRLWCGGVTVDWPALHAGDARRRVPLPGYPFERQRYWVDPAPAAGREAAAGERRNDLGDWFHAPSWKRLPPLPAGTGGEGRRWLLLDAAGGPGGELARRLEAAGDEVVTALPGESLRRTGPRSWVMDAGDGEQVRALLAELDASGLAPDRVVHLASLAADGRDEAGVAGFERRQRLGFHSLIHLARALARVLTEHPGRACRLTAVGSGLDDVLGGEPMSPAAATLAGACRVVAQEHPELACRVVDVAPSAVAEGGAVPAEALARELAVGDLPDGERRLPGFVALRNGVRWGRGFEPVRLPGPAGPPLRLRREGVYLLFGGLGRIGLVLAEGWARELGARLVLAGRSVPGPEPLTPQEWGARLAAGDGDGGGGEEAAALVERLRGMERSGGRVLALQADVSDEAAVRRAVAATRERFGALHGVVHAAGRTRTLCTVGETTPETAELHFRPKAHGALALEAALTGERPDFVLLLSSLSAELGGLGYAAHAAAHRYLDAFALDRGRRGDFPWLSLGLDGWRFGEGRSGAGRASAGRARRVGTARAAVGMTPEEGVEAIRRFLDQAEATHLAVSTTDLEARAVASRVAPAPALAVPGQAVPDQAVPGEAVTGEAAAGVPEGGGPAPRPGRPALGTPFVAPASETEQIIAGLWETVLGVEGVGVVDDFFELGGHSLLGVQLVSRLRETFQVEITLRRVLEQTTVRGLAAVVEEALLAEIAELSDEEAERLLEGVP
ncbi:MAG TPA: SDR family oxidoreductase [Thermoanaerobaculia bacterium]|nr:SDR family oxidoreductase [Thermoanaerobaculia bacterium]